MKKLIFIICTLFLFSCQYKNEIPKKIANEILSSKFNLIDSVFEKNRSITSFYLDKVLVNKPSLYFKNAKHFFNKKYFLSREGQNSSRIPEYLFCYKCEKEVYEVEFRFTKINDKWSLKEIILKDPIDFIK